MCQPPPPVPNAEILTEDDEFEIGKVLYITFKESTLLTEGFALKETKIKNRNSFRCSFLNDGDCLGFLRMDSCGKRKRIIKQEEGILYL